MKYKQLPIERTPEPFELNESPEIGKWIALAIVSLFLLYGLFMVGAQYGFNLGVNYGTNQMAGVQTQYGIVYYLSNATGNVTLDSIKITDLCQNINLGAGQ